MEAFNDKMGFATLTDANKVERHTAFAKASDSCMHLRGTFVVSVDKNVRLFCFLVFCIFVCGLTLFC